MLFLVDTLYMFIWSFKQKNYDILWMSGVFYGFLKIFIDVCGFGDFGQENGEHSKPKGGQTKFRPKSGLSKNLAQEYEEFLNPKFGLSNNEHFERLWKVRAAKSSTVNYMGNLGVVKGWLGQKSVGQGGSKQTTKNKTRISVVGSAPDDQL